SNVTAAWRAHRKGALFANPSFTQIHPTCIPASDEFQSKLTLMSESLRNDGRIWVPTKGEDPRAAGDIPEDERDYYLERIYPSFGNLAPRDVSSRAAMRMLDQGLGVGPLHNGVYLDFRDAIGRLGKETIEARYGNLFEMYHRITDEDPYSQPMRIYPAPHYTMGGLWVDYNLMTNIPGLYALGEANFSDHGANRLGASALMQGLADGYFVISYTVADYLADYLNVTPVPTDDPVFKQAEAEAKDRLSRFLSINGTRTVDDFHRELGKIMLEHCGMARSRAGLEKALSEIPALEEEYYKDVTVLGDDASVNETLEKANRLGDFFELARLMCQDALDRDESCGAHFRVEYQTEEGEAVRNDEEWAFVSAWQWQGNNVDANRVAEPLEFENVELKTRSYK
ncbi:MAG: succinate dehydrogenase (quinone) flavoprotein subunit, partial [Acidimicrobiia bacterium]|nr:succinate dehydrogenase (quinone) flavoprotein subunit [Acidimicrobiia bacterium]